MQTYLKYIPKTFNPVSNPSNTSGMAAFRDAFERGLKGAGIGSFIAGPVGGALGFGVGATSAELRDLGIEQWVNALGSLPDHLRPNMYSAGREAAQKFNYLNSARSLMEKTENRIFDNTLFLAGAGKGLALSSDHLFKDGTYKEKTQRITELANNSEMLDRKSTRLNSSHIPLSRMPSSA